MLVIKVELYNNEVNLKDAVIVCPHCSEDFYIFESNIFNTCFSCRKSMTPEVSAVKQAIYGRLCYHLNN